MLALRNYPVLLVMGLVLMVAVVALKVTNLNYNSAFNDEAIYVVVGKMGLFEGDWDSYNAKAWMGGAPFVYPNMTALAHQLGGLMGSRLLNVLFGVLSLEAVFLVTFMLAEGKEVSRLVGGLVAVGVLGLSSVGHMVSRLATYDMPSFYFFFLGLCALLIAQRKEGGSAKLYFVAAALLILSVAAKLVVGIYMPMVLVYSYMRVKGYKGKRFRLWKNYFMVPFVGAGAAYGLANLDSFSVFYDDQVVTSRTGSYAEVLKLFWETTKYVWGWWLVGSIGMIARKKWKQWLVLSGGAGLILLVHLGAERTLTLDKHTYLAVGFGAMVAGLGLAYLMEIIIDRDRWLRLGIGAVLGGLVIYGYLNYQDSLRYNERWVNTDKVMSFVRERAESDERVLTELGAVTNLALYEIVKPTDVITFDWIDYKGKSGEEGYRAAVRGSHFDWLVLEGESVYKSGRNAELNRLVVENVEDNYVLAYDDGEFLVYERRY